jgi:hypothetical protein
MSAEAYNSDSDSDVEPADTAEEADKELLELILKRYHTTKQAWQTAADEWLAAHRFAAGHQWDEGVAKAREEQNLACVTYNQYPANRRYIVNQARAATPNIKYHPVGEDANKNVARIYDGIAKNIQYKHDAKSAYICALQGCVIGGLGAWRVHPTKTADGVDLEIQRILRPTSVMPEHTSQKKTFADARYWFVESEMSVDSFEEAYPEEDADNAPRRDDDEEMITVIEYWCLNVKSTRWEQYIVTEKKILTRNTEYLGHYSPLVLLTGEEEIDDDGRHYHGIVHGTEDMSRLLNLSKSTTSDWLGRATNAQWLFTREQISGYETVWNSAAINGVVGLPYNHNVDGPPTRLPPPPPPQGSMEIGVEAINDIRATIGIRDPNQPLPANISNKTLQLQLSQSNIGTLEYQDNLCEAIKWTGVIIGDLIPAYYSYPHIREIMGLDGKITTVMLNQIYIENGKLVLHDLKKGTYGVTATAGPSFESQRAETVDNLMTWVKEDPGMAPLARDIIAQNMDFEGASELADRARASLPPNLLAASDPTNGDDADQGKLAQAHVMQMQQQMQQLQQQLQQLQIQNQGLNQILQSKKMELDVKGQQKLQQLQLTFQHDQAMHRLDTQAQLAVVQAKGGVDSGLITDRKNADAQLSILEAHTDIFHDQRRTEPPQVI